jgi:hypothetical protein
MGCPIVNTQFFANSFSLVHKRNRRTSTLKFDVLQAAGNALVPHHVEPFNHIYYVKVEPHRGPISELQLSKNRLVGNYYASKAPKRLYNLHIVSFNKEVAFDKRRSADWRLVERKVRRVK